MNKRRSTAQLSLLIMLSIATLSSSACDKKEPVAPAPRADSPPVEPAGAEVWAPLAQDAMSPAQLKQLEAAQGAAKALGGALMAKVLAAVAESGHVSAIDLCHAEAKPATEQVAAERGVRLGRTSLKLRSPSNSAPDWAAPLISSTEPEAKPRFVSNASGSLGALLPITLAEACVACHGAPDQLAPGVQEALATRYPDDRATGFAPGDLRGWFWVEVPPHE